MAYTAPTFDDFTTRFPAFANINEDTFDAILAEALTQVGETWLEKDYAPAIMYLVAHMYVTETQAGTGASKGPIISESFGGAISVTYANLASQAGSNNPLLATEYGKRFVQLRKNNFPAIRVV